MAAASVSPCVCSLGPDLCFLSSVYQVLFTAPFTGEPVDLFGLSPVPCPTGMYLRGDGGGEGLYCESSVHIHT